MSELTQREKFDLAHESLLFLNRKFVDFVFKSIGATLIILGWLISQKDPLPTLVNDELFWVGIVAITISLAIVVWYSISLCMKSLKVRDLLLEINLVELRYFEGSVISILQVIMFILSELILYKAVYVIIIHEILFAAIKVIHISSLGVNHARPAKASK